MMLAHTSADFDQNLCLKNVKFGIFQHNLRFDVRILTLLPSEPLLEYALYPWFSYGKQNLDVREGFEPRIFLFQYCLSCSRYCHQSIHNSSFTSSCFEIFLNKWFNFIT